MSGKNVKLFLLLNGIHHKIELCYYRPNLTDPEHFPFPKRTQGHLYYCPPSPNCSPISGTFRFRVIPSTSDHPIDFAKGFDLLLPDGRLWELSLYNAIHLPEYAPLVQKLLDEKLIDAISVDAASKLPRFAVAKWSGVLYSLSDPFILALSRSKLMTIMTKDQLVHFRFRLAARVNENHVQYPFSGILFATDIKPSFIYIYSRYYTRKIRRVNPTAACARTCSGPSRSGHRVSC